MQNKCRRCNKTISDPYALYGSICKAKVEKGELPYWKGKHDVKYSVLNSKN